MEIKKPVIELQNVTVVLGGKEILKNVSFKVEHGEILVIIGPSGSGKTVLLKTIAGVYHPNMGKVLVEGKDWEELKQDEKHDLSSRLGMLFQRNALFDSLTLQENIEFPLKEHFEYSDEKMRKISLGLLKDVNLGDKSDRYPYELSGGMQKRLALARALALSPEIVFYDDPVAGQDPIQEDQMTDLILDLKKKFNSTVILVTSSMLTTYKMADRILMVVDGEVLDLGTPEETQASEDPRVQQFINGKLEGPIDFTKL